MSCAVNARTGREAEISLDRASESKRVVVVGGGPGGLEAARVAARRGHRVSLYERGAVLGGSLVMASTVHPDNTPLLEFLCADVVRAGVEVQLEQTLDVVSLARLAPDVVIVATGGQVVVPRVAGADADHVWTGPLLRELIAGRVPEAAATKLPRWQRAGLELLGVRLQRWMTPPRWRAVARRWLPLGPRVAVLGGDLAAVELAEWLAELGRRVAVIEPGADIAREVGLKRRTEHMVRLDRLGVTVHTQAEVDRIDRDAVCLQGGARIVADSVIVAGEPAPDTTLFDALKGSAPEVIAVGDCTGLGLIRKAIEEGARAGASI